MSTDGRFDTVVAGGTVVLPDERSMQADVGITGEQIAAIAAPGSLSGDEVVDATGRYVLPGAIDPHTHHGIYRSLAEDGESESRADLVGGVTTIGNYFRRADPYVEIMDGYLADAEATYHHDYFFSLGLLSFEHIAEIPTIIDRFGITSFKWYKNYKDVAREKFGVDCDMHDDWADQFIETLAAQPEPTTMGHHSENMEITSALGESPYLQTERADTAYRGYETLVEAFPAHAEAQSMIASGALARMHGYEGFYAVHISAGRTADELAGLLEMGWDITGETCLHYLSLTTEECDERHNVNPPVRSAADQETLWARIADGTISCIGTDHCANLRDDKVGEDVPDSLPGFPSSPLLFPLLITDGVHTGRIPIERVAMITATNTADAFHLSPKKGRIAVGADADIAIIDLEREQEVTAELLQGGADYSPYEGRVLRGWPTHTFVRGNLACADGEVLVEPGHGTHIDRPV